MKFILPILLASASLTFAGTWPVWRGDPGMTGVAQEKLAFPLPLAWKFEAAKPVKATAVSDGERFYIGDAKGKFYALGAADGRDGVGCGLGELIAASRLRSPPIQPDPRLSRRSARLHP